MQRRHACNAIARAAFIYWLSTDGMPGHTSRMISAGPTGWRQPMLRRQQSKQPCTVQVQRCSVEQQGRTLGEAVLDASLLQRYRVHILRA